MGKKLSPDQMALYNQIDEILLHDWDPIGVADVPEARDEYHGYLPHVFSLAIHNASVEDIAKYLHMVVSERMELPSEVPDHLPIAKKILAERERVHE